MKGVRKQHAPQKVITASSGVAIVAGAIIGVGVLALPRIAVEQSGTAAPLVTALATLVALGGLLVLVALGKRFPDLSLFQAAEVVSGRLLGKAISLVFGLFFTILTALAAREFGEVIVTVVLKRTPLEVTTVVLILLAAGATRNNIATFGRIQQFYLPFIVFPSLVIVMLSLKNAHTIYLLPIWGPGGLPLVRGTVLTAALFQAFAVWGVVHPYLKDPKHGDRSAVAGLGLAGFVYALAVTGALAVFGPQEILGLLWPTLELAKTTAVPGGIIERLDAPFIIVWVTAVFTTVYATYLVATTAFTHACGLHDHKAFVFPLVPFIYFLALRPHNIEMLYRTITIVGLTGLPLTIGWPLLLWAVAGLRHLRGEESV